MATRNIDKLSTSSELAEFVLRERKRLNSGGLAGGLRMMQAHSNLIDAVIERVFAIAAHEVIGEPTSLGNGVLEDICIVATGGYGRRELCPYSDIDVAFVVSDDDHSGIDLLVKRAYRLLMETLLDGAGLKVGYSYRMPGALEDLPLDVQTALLDARYIAGGQLLSRRFRLAVVDSLVPAEFVHRHVEQRRIVYERLGSTPFVREPNVKEGIGGLRDFHTARWISKAAFGASGAHVWTDLRSHGIMSDLEIARIDTAVEYLSRIRNALHIACERGTDLLAEERQEQIAGTNRLPKEVQSLMELCYRHMECLHFAYLKMAAVCREQSLQIEPGITSRHGQISIIDQGLLCREPEAVIRLLAHGTALGLNTHWRTKDMLRSFARNRRSSKNGQPSDKVALAFVHMLSQQNAGTALGTMHELGLLQWAIPELGDAMYRSPDDAVHEFTIGAHSLETVRQLQALATSEDEELRGVWSGIGERSLLYLAALLHDIGKLCEHRGHSESGGSVAAKIGQRLGLEPESVDRLVFLVRHHLLMSETARMRDLNQERTIRDFVNLIDSSEMLDMLYLLTIADMRSVGQATWAEVQMRFLRELYHRANMALCRTGEVDLSRQRNRMIRELSMTHLTQAEIDEHCNAMPAAYLLNTPLDDLAAHILSARQARSGKAEVRTRDDLTGRFTEVVICAADKSGLLAKVAGVLAVLGVDIHAAQAFTRNSDDRIAIDTLYVEFDGCALSSLKALQVKTELEKAITNELDLGSILQRYGRKLVDAPRLLGLSVVSHLSDEHTVIDVEAEDQPGLLYRLTSAISSLGWNIHCARAGTIGGWAHDAFYVTDANGWKLDCTQSAEMLRQALSSQRPP